VVWQGRVGDHSPMPINSSSENCVIGCAECDVPRLEASVPLAKVGCHDVYRVLAGVCAGAQQAFYANDPLCWNSTRMDDAGRGAGTAAMVVDSSGSCNSLRAGVDFPLFHRAQQTRLVWASALVVVGGSAHGCVDARRKNG
jgi:hypothetical protein